MRRRVGGIWHHPDRATAGNTQSACSGRPAVETHGTRRANRGPVRHRDERRNNPKRARGLCLGIVKPSSKRTRTRDFIAVQKVRVARQSDGLGNFKVDDTVAAAAAAFAAAQQVPVTAGEPARDLTQPPVCFG